MIYSMETYLIVAYGFWLIAVAYASNAFPPLVKGKIPIDKGKKLRNKRLLGDGKTFEGSIAGFLFGLFIGLILLYFQPDLKGIPELSSLPDLSLIMVLLLSIGAILGDMFGSFIKRQFNLKRGRPAPLLDQLDFVIGALLFLSLVYVPPLEVIFFIIIITPIIHWMANIIGYLAGVKNDPW